jgi:hypothetical protein
MAALHRTRLRAYGKLPLSREFVSHQCGGRRAQEFSDFLHAGAEHLDPLPAGGTEAVRVYAPLEAGRATACASLWSSTDQGGQRRFPFAFFGVLAADECPPLEAGFLTAFTPLHEAHELIHERMLDIESSQGFSQILEQNEIVRGPFDREKARERFVGTARTYPTGRWAAALYGTEARRFLVALWRLRNLLIHLSRSRNADECSGIRVPLVRSHRLETQADAWLGLIAHSGVRLPSILLGRFGPEETASLAVFLRPLQPADLDLIVGQPVRGLVDLSSHKEPADMDGFNAFAEAMQVRITESHPDLASLPDILETA